MRGNSFRTWTDGFGRSAVIMMSLVVMMFDGRGCDSGGQWVW